MLRGVVCPYTSALSLSPSLYTRLYLMPHGTGRLALLTPNALRNNFQFPDVEAELESSGLLRVTYKPEQGLSLWVLRVHFVSCQLENTRYPPTVFSTGALGAVPLPRVSVQRAQLSSLWRWPCSSSERIQFTPILLVSFYELFTTVIPSLKPFLTIHQN